MSVDRDVRHDPGVVPPQPVFRPFRRATPPPAPGPARLRRTPRFLQTPPAATAAAATAARLPKRDKPAFARFAAALEATVEPRRDAIAPAAPAEQHRHRPDRRNLAVAGIAGIALIALAGLLGLTTGHDPAPITAPSALASDVAPAAQEPAPPAGGADVLSAGPLLAAFRLPAPELVGSATRFPAHAAPRAAAPAHSDALQASPAAALQPLRFGAPGPGLASGSKLASAAGLGLRGVAGPVGDDPNPLYELGYRLQQKGETESAIAAYQLAAETDPRHPATFYNWGYLLQQQGEEDAARARYRQALELAPQHAFAHYNLAYLLQKAGAAAAAIEHYRAAIAANPHFAWSHYNLGWLEQKQGRLQDALADYRRSIELDPEQPLAYENIAAILRQHR